MLKLLARLLLAANLAMVAGTALGCSTINLNATGKDNLLRDLGLQYSTFRNVAGVSPVVCTINHSNATGPLSAYQAMSRNDVADFIVFYPDYETLHDDRRRFDKATIYLGISNQRGADVGGYATLALKQRVFGRKPATERYREVRKNYGTIGVWQNVTIAYFFLQVENGSWSAAAVWATPKAGTFPADMGVRRLVGYARPFWTRHGQEHLAAAQLKEAVDTASRLSDPAVGVATTRPRR